MAERFDLLGLSAADLISKSPEEAFLQTLTAIQGLNNEADRKFAADELMGGSSEKLAGIINASSATSRLSLPTSAPTATLWAARRWKTPRRSMRNG